MIEFDFWHGVHSRFQVLRERLCFLDHTVVSRLWPGLTPRLGPGRGSWLSGSYRCNYKLTPIVRRAHASHRTSTSRAEQMIRLISSVARGVSSRAPPVNPAAVVAVRPLRGRRMAMHVHVSSTSTSRAAAAPSHLAHSAVSAALGTATAVDPAPRAVPAAAARPAVRVPDG